MKKKVSKVVSLLLSMVLITGLLAGCGSSNQGDSKGSPESSRQESTEGQTKEADKPNEEPYTVTMLIIGNQQDDEAKVEAAINEILMRDLNMKLDLLVVPFASAGEQIRLMLSGGEKLDLMMGLASQAATYVATQSVYDLSDLIDQYSTSIVGALGDAAKIANINGYVYAIPTSCDWYRQTSIMVRTDWMEEAGFAKEDIKNVEDLERLYEAVSKLHPEASMYGMKNGQNYDSAWYTTDPLSDGWGVLMNYGEYPEVVNWFETQEYKDFLDRQYRWAQKGWISKDAATTTDSIDSLIGAGKVFSQVSLNHPAMETEASLNIGVPVTVIPLYEAYTTSTFSTGIYWSVARNSQEPEKAFQMLDYIYGSAEVENLLTWGIEGEHYVVSEDGFAGFPEGMDRSSDPYNANFGYLLPNQFITIPWNGQPENVYGKVAEMNKQAKASCAYGFSYDGTAFTNELAALNNVKGQYLDALNTGAVNPDEVLPELQKALKDAGIDKVIQAKQEQLDAWMAQK